MSKLAKAAVKPMLRDFCALIAQMRAAGATEDDVQNLLAASVLEACGHLKGDDLIWMVRRLQDAASVPRPMPSPQHEAPSSLQ